jgi:protein-S-isoprenylcysteine O-methyltransferase Ste14
VLPVTAARILGAVLIVGAVAIAVPAFRAMARAGTSFRTERATTAIVTDGPFGYTRNPIYVALTLLYGGIALAINSLWVLLLIVPVLIVMRRGVIAREERYLEGKFGDAYLRYKQRVRRWL